MKGYVLSIVSLLFLSLLFAMSTSLHDHYLRMERSLAAPQPVSYAAYSIGSAAVSLNSIVGPGIALEAGNDSLSLSMLDTIPMKDKSQELSRYSALLEGGLANQTHADISANLSAIADGSYDLLICRRYIYSNDEGGDMVFRAVTGGTNASAYEISVSVQKERANVTHINFTGSGDISLTLHYTDMNGTVSESGLVSSSEISRFQAAYPGGGSLEIGVGRASGHDGSLWIVARNATAQAGWKAALPPPSPEDRLGYEYSAPMRYGVGPAGVSRNIGT